LEKKIVKGEKEKAKIVVEEKRREGK